jgi:hypothetical protein
MCPSAKVHFTQQVLQVLVALKYREVVYLHAFIIFD